MPNRVQPGDQIGPNNAGKMILRGCFMNVSQDWIDNVSGQVGGVLTRYLENRHGEATSISLNFGHGVPPGRELGPERVDINFMASVVFRLGGLEKRGDALQQASAKDIQEQVLAQVGILQEEIGRYREQCAEEGIEPMFTGAPSVIIENVLERTAVTHEESLAWEAIDAPDLFEGMTIHHHEESTYEPPTFK